MEKYNAKNLIAKFGNSIKNMIEILLNDSLL